MVLPGDRGVTQAHPGKIIVARCVYGECIDNARFLRVCVIVPETARVGA